MDPFLFRIIRSFACAVIMFFSMRALNFNGAASILASLIPLLLGMVDIMTGTAFGLVGLIFILAVTVHIFPNQFTALGKIAQNSINDLSSTNIVSQTNQPAVSTNIPVSEKK